MSDDGSCVLLASLQHKDTPENNMDTDWEFTAENYREIETVLKKYPANYKRSAVMPLLFIAQKQTENMPEHKSTGWIPLAAMNKIATILDMPPMRVYEVASFYTMYNRTPIGKHNIQVCTTSPCMVTGAYDIVDAIKKHLGVEVGGKLQTHRSLLSCFLSSLSRSCRQSAHASLRQLSLSVHLLPRTVF